MWLWYVTSPAFGEVVVKWRGPWVWQRRVCGFTGLPWAVLVTHSTPYQVLSVVDHHLATKVATGKQSGCGWSPRLGRLLAHVQWTYRVYTIRYCNLYLEVYLSHFFKMYLQWHDWKIDILLHWSVVTQRIAPYSGAYFKAVTNSSTRL